MSQYVTLHVCLILRQAIQDTHQFKFECSVVETSSQYICAFQTDCMSSLEKDRDYREEHFDFIQQHIRRHCLKCILNLHLVTFCHQQIIRRVSRGLRMVPPNTVVLLCTLYDYVGKAQILRMHGSSDSDCTMLKRLFESKKKIGGNKHKSEIIKH